MSPSIRYWQNRLVVVTGGSGFLGSHIVRALTGHGARVRVVALEPPAADDTLCEFVAADIRDSSAVRQALAGAQVVFHAAGNVTVSGPAQRALLSVHVDGTRNLIECAPRDCRIVHTSSLVSVGATVSGVPLTEGAPFPMAAASVPYVQAKRAAEEFALRSDRDVVVTNPAFLIGPIDHQPSVMGRFCVRYWKGRVPIIPPGGLNLVDVRDIAIGHLLAAEHGRSGRRYILGGEDHSYPAIFEMLARVAGYRPRWSPQISSGWLQALALVTEARSRWTGREPYPSLGHVRLNRLHWYCRSDRARSELGYFPRPVIDSLRDTHAWHAERMPLKLSRFGRWWMRHSAAA
jgi:dihydroflavonol-4-reductase